MRNLFFLLLCMSMFGLSSCGGDDDSDAALTMANLAGDWNLTALNNDIDISLDGQAFGEATSNIINSSVVVSFTSAGTWSSTGAFDITIMSTDTTVTETYTDGIGNGTYTVSTGQLSMTGIDSGDESDTETPTVFTVTEFRLNELLDLDGSASETITDPFFNLTISTNVSSQMILER